MKRLFAFCLAGLIGAVVSPSAQAAEPACKFYKVSAPLLYVHMKAEKSAGYIGVLESGIIACITGEQTSSAGQWGYVAYIQQQGGANKPVNGWVSLQFMQLQSNGAAPSAASQATAAPQTAAEQAQEEAEGAYSSTVATGSCAAYQTFIQSYGGSNYGQLAQHFLQTNCTNNSGGLNTASSNAAPIGTTPVSGTAAVQNLSLGELIVSIQQELGRLGCNPGAADGDWGRRTRNAMGQFNRYTNLSLDTYKPSAAALRVLGSTNGTVCPASVKAKKVYPKKKVVKSAKKKSPSGSAKKKEYWGGEDTRIDCQTVITADCF